MTGACGYSSKWPYTVSEKDSYKERAMQNDEQHGNAVYFPSSTKKPISSISSRPPEVSRFVYAVTPVPSSRGRFYTRFFFFVPPP